MVKAAYIHIPFCKSKCHYCSFVSFCKLDLKQEYVKSLCCEIQHFYENEVLNTIYFGGGTPSTLTIPEISRILRLLNFNEQTEITIEVNPDDVEYDYILALYDLGINRISLGCQTFDNEILRQINRRHTSEQVVHAVNLIKNVGFKNVSLDFIYGLPEQSIQMFLDDLEKAVDLEIEHISLYGLKLDEGCYFVQNPPKNLPDDDIQADMYINAVNLLEGLGFEHYEVSNFSKFGFNSRHNLTYWNNQEYYGFGVGANGYKNGVRYANVDSIEKYLVDNLTKKSSTILTKQEKLEEEIFLGLRKMAGINISQINLKYGIDFCEKYREILKKYEGLKLLEKTDVGYKFTLQGVMVSNVILADFIEG
jgi:oxygen-independent coproporphyrinogen-3 oxidase